jgi:hypothetical protein
MNKGNKADDAGSPIQLLGRFFPKYRMRSFSSEEQLNWAILSSRLNKERLDFLDWRTRDRLVSGLRDFWLAYRELDLEPKIVIGVPADADACVGHVISLIEIYFGPEPIEGLESKSKNVSDGKKAKRLKLPVEEMIQTGRSLLTAADGKIPSFAKHMSSAMGALELALLDVSIEEIKKKGFPRYEEEAHLFLILVFEKGPAMRLISNLIRELAAHHYLPNRLAKGWRARMDRRLAAPRRRK